MKLHTNKQKNVYVNDVNMTDIADSSYLKLTFSFHCRRAVRMPSVKVESFSHVGFWFICVCLVDLDDTEKNEKLKFSIVMRLPEVTNDFACCFLDFGAHKQLLPMHRIKLMESLSAACDLQGTLIT